jgi:hypothetical protein
LAREGRLCGAHLGAIPMGDADWECRKHSAAVAPLFVRKHAFGSRIFDGLRCLPAHPLPPRSISRLTSKEADHSAFGVNNWVGGSA